MKFLDFRCNIRVLLMNVIKKSPPYSREVNLLQPPKIEPKQKPETQLVGKNMENTNTSAQT